MEEWKTYKVGDLCDSVSETYKRGSEKVVLINTSDVLDGKCENHSFVDNRDLKGQFKKTFQKDDILYSEIRPANKRFAYVDFDATDYIASTKLMVIRANSKVLPRFLYHHLKNQSTLDELQALAESRSGTFPQITFSELANLELQIPSLVSQEKIVRFIDAVESKIELNNRINHNLEQQAQIVFDRIFNSDLTNNCLLSSIVDINPKRTLRKNEVARCIDMTYLNTAGSFPSGWEFKPYSGGMKFINGDTLMARITPCLENGKVAYINFLDKEETAFGSTEYIVFHAKEGYPNEMFYFLTRNKAFIEFATKNMNGSSGRQRVSGETIGNYIIPVLSEDDINELKTVSESTMKEILKNNLESRVLSEMRNTILPKLMSGELKINDLTC